MSADRLSLNCPRCGGLALNWRAVRERDARPGHVEMECPNCGLVWTEAIPDKRKERDNERQD